MNETIETREFETGRLEIRHDDSHDDPRDWCNSSKISLFHRDYLFPKEHGIDCPEELADKVKSMDGVVRRVRLYEHSEIALSLVGEERPGMACPWDSGIAGIISIDRATMEREGWDEDRALEVMRSELSIYEQYAQGRVYYAVYHNYLNDEVDSIGGLMGDDMDTMIDNAIDHLCPQHRGEVAS